MTDNDTLTLTPHHNDKLGILHCSVNYDGFIVVAGDVSDIADGEEVEFKRVEVTVTRHGDEYTFVRHH